MPSKADHRPKSVPAGEPDDAADEGEVLEPGLLLSAWYAVEDVFWMFFDFFRRNGLLVLLLVVAGMVGLLNYFPSLLSHRTLLLGGFAVAVVFMGGFIVANYRGFIEQRRAYTEERRKYREWNGKKDDE